MLLWYVPPLVHFCCRAFIKLDVKLTIFQQTREIRVSIWTSDCSPKFKMKNVLRTVIGFYSYAEDRLWKRVLIFLGSSNFNAAFFFFIATQPLNSENRLNRNNFVTRGKTTADVIHAINPTRQHSNVREVGCWWRRCCQPQANLVRSLQPIWWENLWMPTRVDGTNWPQ